MAETSRSLHYSAVNKRYETRREYAEGKKVGDGSNGRKKPMMAVRKNYHERESNVDPDYQIVALYRLREAERNENETEKKRFLEMIFVETNQDNVLPCDWDKRERENVDDDGYGSDADPELLYVLDCLKEYGNSYALENENNGLIIYEGECSSDDVSECFNEAKTKPNNRGSIGPSRPHKQKIVQSGKLKENVKQEKILMIAVEEKDNDADSDEIEIFDSPQVIKESNCFVTNRNDADDSNGCAEYRRRVLRVLNEPYDHNEYRRLFEEINVYFKTFPDLKRKLSKNRYWPGKRLPILRGFFYWLQKNPHDGTFKPWKDAECLSVNLTTSNA